ncbi:MAG: L,D-transpeptidase [Magnetococcus sp. WYHC-3]
MAEVPFGFLRVLCLLMGIGMLGWPLTVRAQADAVMPVASGKPAAEAQSLEPGSLDGGPGVRTSPLESRLVEGLRAIGASDMKAALDTFSQLTREQPTFRLAQLIYGDLLMSQARGVSHVGGGVADGAPGREALEGLLDEARARISHFRSRPDDDRLPADLLHFSSREEHAVVVDLSESRLYLFENSAGIPQLVADFYISSGKNGADKQQQGDKRTPVGLYFITDHLPDSKLPDFYGAGALPISYPNEWDQERKRTGYGIWLHGTPVNTYSRPPRASDGCVALTNPDFKMLENFTAVGTPVILSRKVTWLDQAEWHARKALFLDHVVRWQSDWDSGDVKRVLQHYSPEFSADGVRRESLPQRLEHLMAADKAAGMGTMSDPSVLGHPGDESLMVITFFVQGGDEGEGDGLRRQYWRQDSDGVWRIVYERMDPALRFLVQKE